jgi:hypothetical protein
MEVFTILLASLLAAISPAGFIVDKVVANTLRSQVKEVEQLEVRIDNSPSYQILQGKVERIRIASRGLQPIPNLRIETLELETDPLDMDLQRLRRGGKRAVSESLRQPLQGAVHLIVTEVDMNRALQSSKIKSQLQKMIDRLIPKPDDSQAENYEILNSNIDLLGNNRLRLQMQLRNSNSQEQGSSLIDIMLEVGLNLVAGRSLQLIDPIGTLNGKKLSSGFLKRIAESDRLTQYLNLQRLEKQGIVARVLEFKIGENAMNAIGFIRLEPPGKSTSNSTNAAATFTNSRGR